MGTQGWLRAGGGGGLGKQRWAGGELGSCLQGQGLRGGGRRLWRRQMSSMPMWGAPQEDALILQDGFSRTVTGPDFGFRLSFSFSARTWDLMQLWWHLSSS